ncbi:hypothetical protein [Helicobacter sp. WB40]|uniref:hypothetical protein n=1 Tax=Helicobacter sp. WB40 TaxID=3004130 RepID=UPI0022EBCEC5|nr:hypothetical protein [Helicobacter sp. WB40]MDA3967554.1 hypothetical protein [Helicobacter sp. WB40]
MKNLGISRCYDGISFVANLLNKHYKEKYKNKRIIAIALNGYELSQKHLGDIPRILKDSNFNIVYILSFASKWHKELICDLEQRGEDYILADYEFVEALDFFPFVICQAEFSRYNAKVASLKLFTSADMVQNYAYLNREVESSIQLGFFLSTYVNIHSKSHLKYISKKQQFANLVPDPSYKFLLGGYPSIDKEAKACLCSDIPKDSVIFVSTHLNFEYPRRLATIIKHVLDCGFRVVFKSNPAHCELENIEKDFVKEFLTYDNFVFYDNSTPRLNKEELQRSISLVESCSSMLYSYPIATKKPSIIMYPKRDSISFDTLENDCFYNDKIHIRIFEEDDYSIVEILKKLQEEQESQKWKDKIEDYCKNDLYNFGNASKEIAKWIIEWYENMEIMYN